MAKNETESEKFWEMIRWLANEGRSGLLFLKVLRNSGGCAIFDDRKKGITVPSEKVLDGMESRDLIICDNRNKFRITETGLGLLRTFDRLIKEFDEMQSNEPEVLIQMVKDGRLRDLLTHLSQKALEPPMED